MKITSDKDKGEINSRSVDIHLDDKSSVIDAVTRSGVQGILFVPGSRRSYRSVRTLDEFLEMAAALTPKPHECALYD